MQMTSTIHHDSWQARFRSPDTQRRSSHKFPAVPPRQLNSPAFCVPLYPCATCAPGCHRCNLRPFLSTNQSTAHRTNSPVTHCRQATYLSINCPTHRNNIPTSPWSSRDSRATFSIVVVSTAPIFIGSSAVSPLALGNDVYPEEALSS